MPEADSIANASATDGQSMIPTKELLLTTDQLSSSIRAGRISGESVEDERFPDWLSPTFSSVIMQPTTLCNLDCRYCYLPSRRERLEMPDVVARSVVRSIERQASSEPVSVVWHGGEPLATGLQKMEALLAPFEELRRQDRVHHYVQTNATLITEPWCDLFEEYEFRVGVSIDGAEAHNLARVDWRGQPAFERIERGIRRLRERDLPFSVIAVVTKDSITDYDELLDYLQGLGAWSIGFNIEEVEGVNDQAVPPSMEQAQAFWRAVIETTAHRQSKDESAAEGQAGSQPSFREVERLAQYLGDARPHGGDRAAWSEIRQDPIPTVAWNGAVTLLSPELAGFADKGRGSFVAGNVLRSSLGSVVEAAGELWYVRDFGRGLEQCQAKCSFFDFCLGGHAANKFFENGDLATTETNHCRVSKQALVQAMADAVRGE